MYTHNLMTSEMLRFHVE